MYASLIIVPGCPRARNFDYLNSCLRLLQLYKDWHRDSFALKPRGRETFANISILTGVTRQNDIEIA